MGSNGLEKRIGRVWHVAVQAIAAFGLWLVSGMEAKVRGEFLLLMALRARLRTVVVCFQLPRWIAAMHGMTGNTRQFTAGETAARQQRRILATPSEYAAVVPPSLTEEIQIPFEMRSILRCRIGSWMLRVEARFVDVFSWAVEGALFGKPHREFFFGDVNPMTLSADLTGTFMIQQCRVNDGFVVTPELLFRLMLQGLLLQNMRFSRAMTGFTGDAELSHA